MVGGTTHQQQQAPQLAPTSSSSSSAAHTTTAEEDELLKRNTDCVYFLASPLTCKKGSECEFRHSDIARVNPRDCWYWLNGNCLNPKCAFRHPPLDGLLGADVSTPMGPSVPAAHATPYAMPKQGVACIFFQKGFCLKGHLCPFLHGPPNSVNNKPAQSGSANPVPDPPKMPQSGPEKPSQQQKPTQHAPISKMTPILARNGGNAVVDKKTAPPFSVEEPPRYKPARVVPPLVINEKLSSKANRGVYHVPENDRILNGKDADEYLREPSPGFDVLVDNEVEDSEYFHDKDEFGRSRGQVYDVDHPVDYDVDLDMYREQCDRDFDHYNDARSHSPDRFNGPDLRHRISKQRRGSDHNLRSVVSHENHADRIMRGSHHHHRPDQGTLSSRLRGRIKIPGRSPSPTKEHNSRVEREFDRERKHFSRYSPGRPLALNQGRLRDRIKGHQDLMSDNDTMFVGPKRLSELKSVRTEHQPNGEQLLGKRKYPKVENDLSFEGPKPLSEILKRKKGVNSSSNNNNDNNNHVSSVKNEDNNQKERESVPADNKKHSSVSVNFEAETEKPTDGKSVNYAANEVEKEAGLIDEDALLDEELEGYDDHRDGDYEYEQMDDEEDYNLDEGEYVDEEDGDEFGKKESVVYS